MAWGHWTTSWNSWLFWAAILTIYSHKNLGTALSLKLDFSIYPFWIGLFTDCARACKLLIWISFIIYENWKYCDDIVLILHSSVISLYDSSHDNIYKKYWKIIVLEYFVAERGWFLCCKILTKMPPNWYQALANRKLLKGTGDQSEFRIQNQVSLSLIYHPVQKTSSYCGESRLNKLIPTLLRSLVTWSFALLMGLLYVQILIAWGRSSQAVSRDEPWPRYPLSSVISLCISYCSISTSSLPPYQNDNSEHLYIH